MTEYIQFPMAYVNITTGPNELSHLGTNAIDNAGKDTGIDNVFAPFSAVVKKIWPNGNTVWLESLAPVLFADGTIDYCTANFTHDNNVSDLKVGQLMPQGVPFYQEGTAGNASGNHVHISIAKGKFTGTGWYLTGTGKWELNNSINPTAAFWLKPDTQIINTRGLTFKRIEEDMVTRDSLENAFAIGLDRMPYKENYDQWVGKITNEQLLATIRNSKEFKDRMDGLRKMWQEAQSNKSAASALDTIEKIRALVA